MATRTNIRPDSNYYNPGTGQAADSTSAFESDGAARYIPALFASKTLKNFYAMTVFGDIANTDYQGMIKGKGDVVYIRHAPTMTIGDYDIGDTISYEAPYANDVELVIDQAKYWAFKVDDIDKVQTDVGLVNMYSNEAAEQMKVTIDTALLAYLYDQAHASNAGLTAGAVSGDINLGVSGTPFQLTTSNIVDKLVDCGLVIDEQNVTGQKWIVMPNWACALLKKGELRRADITGDSTGVIRNGLLGEVDGFRIYKSNLTNTASDGGNTVHYIHFGTKEAITFASQLTESEQIRIQSSFGTYFRGLKVYGRKVVQPEALGTLYAYK